MEEKETQENNPLSETPSFDPFSDLSEEKKEEIKEYVTKWQNAPRGSGERNCITSKAYKLFGPRESREYQYYMYLKTAKKKPTTERKAPTLKQQEAIEREAFAKVLREYIRDNLYLNKNLDFVNGVFDLGKNFNLPPYFWMRMSSQILLEKKKEEKCNKKSDIHSWQLATGILKVHKQEFVDMLQKTEFKDIIHVCNSIIFLINKYLLPTYKSLMDKARKQVIAKKKAEKELQEQQMFIIDKEEDISSKDTEKEGGIKRIRKINFD